MNPRLVTLILAAVFAFCAGTTDARAAARKVPALDIHNSSLDFLRTANEDITKAGRAKRAAGLGIKDFDFSKKKNIEFLAALKREKAEKEAMARAEAPVTEPATVPEPEIRPDPLPQKEAKGAALEPAKLAEEIRKVIAIEMPVPAPAAVAPKAITEKPAPLPAAAAPAPKPQPRHIYAPQPRPVAGIVPMRSKAAKEIRFYLELSGIVIGVCASLGLYIWWEIRRMNPELRRQRPKADPSTPRPALAKRAPVAYPQLALASPKLS